MKLELFDELYQHAHADSSEFVKIRNGNQYFSYLIPMKDMHEHIRQLVSDIATTCVLMHLKERGILQSLKTPSEEENISGIDVFVPKPCQAKIRQERHDIPEMRWKLKDDGTREEGRDYRCISNNKTEKHLVAPYCGGRFRVVYEIDSKELLEKSNLMDQDLEENKVRLSSLNKVWCSRGDGIYGCEAWWKRVVGRERYSKINYYFKPQLFTSLVTHQISSSEGDALEAFYKVAWNHVRKTHICFNGAL